MSLTSSVEVGLCQDGGDIETGAGMDIGGGLVTNAATGLSLDVRTRSLVVHPPTASPTAVGRMSLEWDPTPSSPLRLAARVAFMGRGRSWTTPRPSATVG